MEYVYTYICNNRYVCMHITIYLIHVHMSIYIYIVICFLLNSVTNSVGAQRRFPLQSVEINSSKKKENSGKNIKMSWDRL